MSSENNKQEWIEREWDARQEDWVTGLDANLVLDWVYELLDNKYVRWTDREDFTQSYVSFHEKEYGDYLGKLFDERPDAPEEDEHERGIE